MPNRILDAMRAEDAAQEPLAPAPVVAPTRPRNRILEAMQDEERAQAASPTGSFVGGILGGPIVGRALGEAAGSAMGSSSPTLQSVDKTISDTGSYVAEPIVETAKTAAKALPQPIRTFGKAAAGAGQAVLGALNKPLEWTTRGIESAMIAAQRPGDQDLGKVYEQETPEGGGWAGPMSQAVKLAGGDPNTPFARKSLASLGLSADIFADPNPLNWLPFLSPASKLTKAGKAVRGVNEAVRSGKAAELGYKVIQDGDAMRLVKETQTDLGLTTKPARAVDLMREALPVPEGRKARKTQAALLKEVEEAELAAPLDIVNPDILSTYGQLEKGLIGMPGVGIGRYKTEGNWQNAIAKQVAKMGSGGRMTLTETERARDMLMPYFGEIANLKRGSQNELGRLFNDPEIGKELQDTIVGFAKKNDKAGSDAFASQIRANMDTGRFKKLGISPEVLPPDADFTGLVEQIPYSDNLAGKVAKRLDDLNARLLIEEKAKGVGSKIRPNLTPEAKAAMQEAVDRGDYKNMDEAIDDLYRASDEYPSVAHFVASGKSGELAPWRPMSQEEFEMDKLSKMAAAETTATDKAIESASRAWEKSHANLTRKLADKQKQAVKLTEDVQKQMGDMAGPIQVPDDHPIAKMVKQNDSALKRAWTRFNNMESRVKESPTPDNIKKMQEAQVALKLHESNLAVAQQALEHTRMGIEQAKTTTLGKPWMANVKMGQQIADLRSQVSEMENLAGDYIQNKAAQKGQEAAMKVADQADIDWANYNIDRDLNPPNLDIFDPKSVVGYSPRQVSDYAYENLRKALPHLNPDNPHEAKIIDLADRLGGKGQFGGEPTSNAGYRQARSDLSRTKSVDEVNSSISRLLDISYDEQADLLGAMKEIKNAKAKKYLDRIRDHGFIELNPILATARRADASARSQGAVHLARQFRKMLDDPNAKAFVSRVSDNPMWRDKNEAVLTPAGKPYATLKQVIPGLPNEFDDIAVHPHVADWLDRAFADTVDVGKLKPVVSAMNEVRRLMVSLPKTALRNAADSYYKNWVVYGAESATATPIALAALGDMAAKDLPGFITSFGDKSADKLLRASGFVGRTSGKAARMVIGEGGMTSKTGEVFTLPTLSQELRDMGIVQAGSSGWGIGRKGKTSPIARAIEKTGEKGLIDKAGGLGKQLGRSVQAFTDTTLTASNVAESSARASAYVAERMRGMSRQEAARNAFAIHWTASLPDARSATSVFGQGRNQFAEGSESFLKHTMAFYFFNKHNVPFWWKQMFKTPSRATFPLKAESAWDRAYGTDATPPETSNERLNSSPFTTGVGIGRNNRKRVFGRDVSSFFSQLSAMKTPTMESVIGSLHPFVGGGLNLGAKLTGRPVINRFTGRPEETNADEWRSIAGSFVPTLNQVGRVGQAIAPDKFEALGLSTRHEGESPWTAIEEAAFNPVGKMNYDVSYQFYRSSTIQKLKAGIERAQKIGDTKQERALNKELRALESQMRRYAETQPKQQDNMRK